MAAHVRQMGGPVATWTSPALIYCACVVVLAAEREAKHLGVSKNENSKIIAMAECPAEKTLLKLEQEVQL